MKEKQIMGVTLAFWCQSGRSGETDGANWSQHKQIHGFLPADVLFFQSATLRLKNIYLDSDIDIFFSSYRNWLIGSKHSNLLHSTNRSLTFVLWVCFWYTHVCRRGDRDDHRTCTLLTRRYIILDAAVHIFQRSYSAVSFDFSPNILNPVTIDSIKMDESSIQVLNELTLSHMPLTDFES